jgi:hypothetical protein
MVTNFISFCLCGEVFTSPSFPKDSFAEYSSHGSHGFFHSFSTLNISSHSSFACKIFIKRAGGGRWPARLVADNAAAMSASQASAAAAAAGLRALQGGLGFGLPPVPRKRAVVLCGSGSSRGGGPSASLSPTAWARGGQAARGLEGVRCPRMGILFTRIWRLFNHQEHKVIIVGLDNAGKTTILYQFSMNEVVHTSPTIGSNVEEIVINNTRFLMWDIGGQESLRSSWNTYYTNTEVMFPNMLELLCSECLRKT